MTSRWYENTRNGQLRKSKMCNKSRLLVATNNQGKLKEIWAILKNLNLELLSSADIGLELDVEEDGQTYAENAAKKALAFSQASGLASLADDSGLEVDALNGEPGIYSARYAGEGGGDAANNRKLLEALAEVPDDQRSARFQCVMVFMRHAKDPTPLVCQGSWEGRILREPQGANGFGYDPLFWVPGENATAAELPAEVKNAQSHRGKALRCLLEQLAARGF
jgi:XTP/dITP diphosphohydrolase